MARPTGAWATLALTLVWALAVVRACDPFYLRMYDTYGDGWNGNFYMIYSLHTDTYHYGTLHSGASEERELCLSDDCWVFVVDGGNWDEEISWEFLSNISSTFEESMNGTAPMVTHFCTDGGALVDSDEAPAYNVTFTINYGFTNDGDGWFGNEADCYVEVELEGETLDTSVIYDDRTPQWEEDLVFSGCVADDENYLMLMYDSDTLTSDDLILGPWYTTLAYLMGVQLMRDYDPVTWMLYDGDLDYVVFTVELTQCPSSYYSPPTPTVTPTALPAPVPTHTWGPSPAPSTPSPTPLTVAPTTPAPTTPVPTLDPTPVGNSLALVEPRSGTNWRTGEIANITWETTGVVGPVSLFLFVDGAFAQKIAFMLNYNASQTCDENQLRVGIEDDDCNPVTEHEHDGLTDDVFFYFVPHGLGTSDQYQVEAFAATGQFAVSDAFTITATPTPAPTHAPVSDEAVPRFLLGMAVMGVAFVVCGGALCGYRKWKHRGRPGSWLYDTHIRMDGAGHDELRVPGAEGVEMGTLGRTTVVLNGEAGAAEAEVVSFATATAVPVRAPSGKSDHGHGYARANASAAAADAAAAVSVQGEVLGVLGGSGVISALHQSGPSATL